MTPFDTALRVQRREVDTVKVSISTEVERIAALDAETRSHDQRVHEERALAYSLPFSSDAWQRRMKSERIRLDDASRTAQIRLGQLRDQALEAFGTMRAIEGAADRFQAETDRIVAAAEQGQIDDIAAARFIKAKRMEGRA